jgi:hypothetical protein
VQGGLDKNECHPARHMLLSGDLSPGKVLIQQETIGLILTKATAQNPMVAGKNLVSACCTPNQDGIGTSCGTGTFSRQAVPAALSAYLLPQPR